MTVIIDAKTNMVMNVVTGEEPVVLRGKEESEFGMPDWDYD